MDDWSLTWVRAATLYTGPIAAAVQGLKYDGQRELARFLARYLVAAFQRPPWVHLMAGSNRMLDVVVPVPLHRKRFQERGYNQAGLVAQAFAPLVHLRSSSSVLTREHFSQSQVELQFDERQTNVKDAFRVTQDVKGKRVLLIDDVYTTGATLNECAKTLRLAGAREVYGLTIAMPTTTNSFLANS